MVTSSSDKDDGEADQAGASPPAQPIPPGSSLSSPSEQPTLSSSSPPPPLHYQWEPQPHINFSIPEPNDGSLFDMIRYISILPPHAGPAAPFVQPAISPPPEMQPTMQPQHCNHQPPVMLTMQGSQYNGYLGAAWVHDPAHYALLTDAPLRLPPSSTTFATTARNAGGIEEGGEEAVDAVGDEAGQEVVEYADTSLPGVRFKPTDEEMIDYLRWKYLGRSMPVDFIKEFNVFKYHPSTIEDKCGDSIDGAWYVFSPRHRKYKNGFRPTRSVEEVGYWKSNTKEAAIKGNKGKIGKVNSLTFMLGRQPKGTPTPWKMKEYRIEEYRLNPNPPDMLLDPWVICKLFHADTDQDDVPVQDQTDEGGEHVDAANGSGGEDSVDGNQPTNDPEHELDIEDYLAHNDFAHEDPGDQ